MEDFIYFGVVFKIPQYPTYNKSYWGNICSNKINDSIKHGDIKEMPCEICGSVNGIEKHHEDYSKPLDVRWLCRRHHLDIHAIIHRLISKRELSIF